MVDSTVPAQSERRARLGQALDSMVRILNALQQSPMSETIAYLAQRTGKSKEAIYKWRSGQASPLHYTIEQLVEIGVCDANMNREWAEETLWLGRNANVARVLARLFPEAAGSVRHNLPHRRERFIGRDTELAAIRQLLHPKTRQYIVPIEGAPGIGKSALALELCWRSIGERERDPEDERFNAIIWASAQRSIVTERGIVERPADLNGLEDLLHAIAEVLDVAQNAIGTLAERTSEARRALRGCGRVLLFLDNWDELDDPGPLLAFLRELPPQAKALITTRYHEDLPFPYRLPRMSRPDMEKLLRYEAESRDFTLSADQADYLLELVDGIPLAASLAVGLMSNHGYGVETTRRLLVSRSESICDFLFGKAIERLKQQDMGALHMLCALAFFSPETGATLDTLHDIAPCAAEPGVDPREAGRIAMRHLANLGLVAVSGQGEERYLMLPLTCEYVLKKVSPQYPAWEIQARERWVAWYLELARAHGGLEWTDWGKGFDTLQREWHTFIRVFHWCDTNQHTQALDEFWLDDLISAFAELYGHWGEMLHWLRRRAEGAERQHDWRALTRAQAIASRLLIFQGQLDEAEAALTSALERSARADTVTCLLLALDTAMLRIYQHSIEAEPALAAYLEQIEEATASQALDARHIGRFRALYLAYRGRLFADRQEWAHAERCYDELLALGHEIGWKRAHIKALLSLGNLALAQRELGSAHIRLQECRTSFGNDRDVLHLAKCEQSQMRLALARRDWLDARERANNAATGFHELGMLQDEREAHEVAAASYP